MRLWLDEVSFHGCLPVSRCRCPVSRGYLGHRLCRPMRDAARAQVLCGIRVRQLPHRHAQARVRHNPRYRASVWPLPPHGLASHWRGSQVHQLPAAAFLLRPLLHTRSDCSRAAPRNDSDLRRRLTCRCQGPCDQDRLGLRARQLDGRGRRRLPLLSAVTPVVTVARNSRAQCPWPQLTLGRRLMRSSFFPFAGHRMRQPISRHPAAAFLWPGRRLSPVPSEPRPP